MPEGSPPTSPRGGRPAPTDSFYFGEPQLYGCLHPGRGGRSGVVVCYPYGHEYIAIHRAARLLATQTSRAGLATLRFDYSGTGDSAGEMEDARLDQWVHEIGVAADELRARAGVESLCLVGIRLGASLAHLAAGARDDIDRLALWDPVISGKAYLLDMERDSRRMLSVAHVVQADRRPEARGDREVLGFPLPDGIVSDLTALELDIGRAPTVERVLLVESQEASSARLGAALRTAGLQVETRTEESSRLWRWTEDITKVQMPHAIVRTLAQWIVDDSA